MSDQLPISRSGRNLSNQSPVFVKVGTRISAFCIMIEVIRWMWSHGHLGADFVPKAQIITIFYIGDKL